MKGAVAAGHPLTAEAGAEVLREGGNAVDACIAAAFVSWVAESTLTGPGAGGFMLVHRATDASSRVLDHFVAVPGLGLGRSGVAEMDSVDVFYTPESSQVFRIGAASCAVPGAAAGLGVAHRRWATLPWRELLQPAIRHARAGIVLTEPQADLHAVQDPILRHTKECAAIYGPAGEQLVAGDKLVMTDLAGTLELLAERGADELYHGELGRQIVHHLRAQGSAVTERDFAEYRVIQRRPVRASFLENELESNPPPSSSGLLLALGVRLLDRAGGLAGPAGSAEAMAQVVELMQAQEKARAVTLATVARRLRASSPESLRGTTHISVVDARGNAASLTASTGSGSGVVVPGTGIQLNNMLGEFDLVLETTPKPGVRFTSGMAPSIVLRNGRPRLVVGSAGSSRLRGAIFQILVNVVGHGLGVEEALEYPRIHFEDPYVECEGGNDPVELDRLESRGYDLVRWRGRNLYFGGASGVERRADGSLAAAGDPRRGGRGIVVE
jgi:gamma-glutamyltranspeptidase/glutathione hydrolase